MVNEEHINEDESHYVDQCPGPEECACARGLVELLRKLDAEEGTFVRVTE